MKQQDQHLSGPNDSPRPEDSVVEPLPALARFAFEWAGTLCDTDHGCFDYHRMWSMVRLLETGGALPQGEDFFDAELPKVARDGRLRIILSGGADTGLLTLAVNASRRSGLTPEIVMLDRCATPLEQCRLFARSIGANFHPIQGTIDQLDVPPADAIMAHSFVPFFPPDARPALFRDWARNLRPGGKVLMSQRLVPVGGTYARIFEPGEIEERRESLAAAFMQQQPINVDLETFLEAAERLWRHQLSGPGVSEDDIKALCATSGLSVEAINYAHQTAISPTAPKSSMKMRKRAGIVIIKPDQARSPG